MAAALVAMPVQADESAAPESVSTEEAEPVDVKGIVFGHIGDAYEWHITDIGETKLIIPLPVIVYSSTTGWHCFLSSRLEENHGSYEGFSIAPTGSPYEGKLVEHDAAGNEVRLSDYLGKPVVLNFWASWCGPCRMEMPHFQEKQLELEGEIQFLMVNVTTGRETLESAQEFIAGQGYTFPVFYDTEADAAMAYGAYSLPATYFIDAEGYAIAHARGAIDAATLQTGIDMIAE